MKVNLIQTSEDYNKHFNIIVDNTIIGYISFRENKNSINIESINININHRRKGIGSILIKQLLKEYKTIHGFSSPLSIGFWKNVGAEFEYDITDEMVNDLMDMGEYPPFIIY